MTENPALIKNSSRNILVLGKQEDGREYVALNLLLELLSKTDDLQFVSKLTLDFIEVLPKVFGMNPAMPEEDRALYEMIRSAIVDSVAKTTATRQVVCVDSALDSKSSFAEYHAEYQQSAVSTHLILVHESERVHLSPQTALLMKDANLTLYVTKDVKNLCLQVDTLDAQLNTSSTFSLPLV